MQQFSNKTPIFPRTINVSNNMNNKEYINLQISIAGCNLMQEHKT